jgi:hypothetical protein
MNYTNLTGPRTVVDPVLISVDTYFLRNNACRIEFRRYVGCSTVERGTSAPVFAADLWIEEGAALRRASEIVTTLEYNDFIHPGTADHRGPYEKTKLWVISDLVRNTRVDGGVRVELYHMINRAADRQLYGAKREYSGTHESITWTRKHGFSSELEEFGPT